MAVAKWIGSLSHHHGQFFWCASEVGDKPNHIPRQGLPAPWSLSAQMLLIIILSFLSLSFSYSSYDWEFPSLIRHFMNFLIILIFECLHAYKVFFMCDFGIDPVWAASLAISILLGNGCFTIKDQHGPVLSHHCQSSQPATRASRHWKECHSSPGWLLSRLMLIIDNLVHG